MNTPRPLPRTKRKPPAIKRFTDTPSYSLMKQIHTLIIAVNNPGQANLLAEKHKVTRAVMPEYAAIRHEAREIEKLWARETQHHQDAIKAKKIKSK